MQRREWLQFAGCFAASVAAPGLLGGCSGSGRPAGTGRFAQGVASGDPRPGSVVVWTRVEPAGGADQRLSVTAEIATTPGFESVLLQQHLEIGAESDHTLRLLVTDLQPDSVYYYRFRLPDGTASPTGRTLTAPAADAAADVDFAFVSCQDREHGFYAAYRRLINDDLQRPAAQRLRFVLHLGDFVYETVGGALQVPIDAQSNPRAEPLLDRHGDPRTVAPLPGGAVNERGERYALTLADYRHLYKAYLADPDLQAARARWPFIHVWDDHEFSDDCWQSEANYRDSGVDSSTDEPSQRRKVAANQAWFEYMPVDLTNLEGVDPDLRQARAFEYAEVADSPNTVVDENNLAANEDNRRAIATLAIYRSFRFGSLVELVATDNRSYRSDHALPEDLSGNLPVFLHPRAVLPKDIVNDLDAGRTANGGDPDTFLFLGDLFLNPRRNSPAGTVLGARQKAWWKETLRRSGARWKLWANSVPLQRLAVNLSALDPRLPDAILSGDTWDGYRSERNELMGFVLDNGIAGLVSLCGDVHAHFAGTVMDDYDAPSPRPAIAELVCAGVSSISQFAAAERLSRRENPGALETSVASLIAYPDPLQPGRVVNNLNNTLLNGVAAGLAAATTHSPDAIAAARDPAHNAHLRYADTEAQGFARVHVSALAITAELLTLESIAVDVDAPGLKRAAAFELPYRGPGEGVVIDGPQLSGTPPFPLP